MATFKNKVFNIMYGKVWLDGDLFVRNMDASVELRHYLSLLQRKFFFLYRMVLFLSSLGHFFLFFFFFLLRTFFRS